MISPLGDEICAKILTSCGWEIILREALLETGYKAMHPNNRLIKNMFGNMFGNMPWCWQASSLFLGSASFGPSIAKCLVPLITAWSYIQYIYIFTFAPVLYKGTTECNMNYTLHSTQHYRFSNSRVLGTSLHCFHFLNTKSSLSFSGFWFVVFWGFFCISCDTLLFLSWFSTGFDVG